MTQQADWILAQSLEGILLRQLTVLSQNEALQERAEVLSNAAIST